MENVTERPQQADAGGRWFVLPDPYWDPGDDEDVPPLEAVVGLWPFEDGKVGKFRSNPAYRPIDEDSPTDPIDAVLRLVLQRRAESRHIQLALRDSLVDLAMNGDGRPLVTDSPDDVPCVVVATGELHRLRVSSPDWRRVELEELVRLLADGVDVLYNPGGVASVRLTGDFLRDAVSLSDEEVAAFYAEQMAGPGDGQASAGEPGT
ncbi:type VII secretion system-associated protein [Lentzea sp. NPDC059081]|uniref:type VII secretion system-associated protein n=1 Tax=Lentzea sp. NPDC059081 TaxID=3346719 RepID=UPI0036B97D8E